LCRGVGDKGAFGIRAVEGKGWLISLTQVRIGGEDTEYRCCKEKIDGDSFLKEKKECNSCSKAIKFLD
jgi:hypothetical protein